MRRTDSRAPKSASVIAHGPGSSEITTGPHPSTPSAPSPQCSLLRFPLEDLACALILAFFSMQGSIPGLSPAQAHEITGSAPTAYTTTGGILSQLVVNGIILVLLLRHPRLLLRRIASVPWIVSLALLAIASTAWSLDPLLTLRRSVPFALAGLFGLWFASRFSLEHQLAILRLAMTGLALATLAIVLLNPSIGLDLTPGHPTDWKGVFTQKNACGRIMVLATAAVLFAERLTPARLLSLALFVFILIMSGSRGAWMIEAAILVLWLLLLFARRASGRVRLIAVLAAPLVLFAVVAAGIALFPRLAPLLGRDVTLSGRTAIWVQVLHFITQRPLFGYGYDAFWRGMTGPSLQIDSAVHFIVVHAHNGFFEICLELGAAGLVLFLLSWMQGLSKLWPLWRCGNMSRLAWPLAILVLIVLYDLDENTLLIYNGLFWVLYVAALVTIEQLSRDSRHTQISRPRAILTLRRSSAGLRSATAQRVAEAFEPAGTRVP